LGTGISSGSQSGSGSRIGGSGVQPGPGIGGFLGIGSRGTDMASSFPLAVDIGERSGTCAVPKEIPPAHRESCGGIQGMVKANKVLRKDVAETAITTAVGSNIAEKQGACAASKVSPRIEYAGQAPEIF
jgi:hypothetical protein